MPKIFSKRKKEKEIKPIEIKITKKPAIITENTIVKPIKKNISVVIKKEKTRCGETIDAIIKMTEKCEKGTEQIEFYTYTALDQCLKRLTGYCPPN